MDGSGADQNMVDDEESDYRILAPDLLKLIQTSILTFYTFLRMDKKKAGGVRNLFGSQNQIATSLQHVQQVVEKVLILKSNVVFYSQAEGFTDRWRYLLISFYKGMVCRHQTLPKPGS